MFDVLTPEFLEEIQKAVDDAGDKAEAIDDAVWKRLTELIEPGHGIDAQNLFNLLTLREFIHSQVPK
jgi:phytoene/squalene synthetase